MKFGPKGLQFTLPFRTVFRRYLPFIGRENTIHLQETAAVIECDRIRFWLPVLDVFIRRAFSERTMVTIPYSRIVRHVTVSYLAVKVGWWLLASAALAWWGMLFVSTVNGDRRSVLAPEDILYILALLALILLVGGVLVHVIFRTRQALTFRRADGKRCVVCFRFASRKRRRQFTELLQANRDAARSPAAPPERTLKAARSTRREA